MYLFNYCSKGYFISDVFKFVTLFIIQQFGLAWLYAASVTNNFIKGRLISYILNIKLCDETTIHNEIKTELRPWFSQTQSISSKRNQRV